MPAAIAAAELSRLVSISCPESVTPEGMIAGPLAQAEQVGLGAREEPDALHGVRASLLPCDSSVWTG